MDILSTIRKQLAGMPLAMPEPDYSGFTLIELLTVRYSIDKLPRESSLEYEIQKRCEHIRQQVNGTARAPHARAFKPYGLRAGVILFCLTVGPFVTFTFLSGISLIKSVDDTMTLLGVWALLTLPALVTISMIGGRIDAERIIKCFNLSGHKAGEKRKDFYAIVNAL